MLLFTCIEKKICSSIKLSQNINYCYWLSEKEKIAPEGIKKVALSKYLSTCTCSEHIMELQLSGREKPLFFTGF